MIERRVGSCRDLEELRTVDFGGSDFLEEGKLRIATESVYTH